MCAMPNEIQPAKIGASQLHFFSASNASKSNIKVLLWFEWALVVNLDHKMGCGVVGVDGLVVSAGDRAAKSGQLTIR